ncbi:hypothetical protein HQN90_17670 [Paenibacillus alba]|uniref:hypothetical protein n=1 Tax=Paenibacillus alba TaxID=1197127 RepID=UPI001567199F|nr:hypothetical protein [Paenibacillus alba]NQX67953.1 hypothetical protein [Paenibacillus alba]
MPKNKYDPDLHSKKFNKTKATAFFKAVLGTAKGIEPGNGYSQSFYVQTGMVRCHAWVASYERDIYMQIGINGHIIASYHFDFDSFEPNYKRVDSDSRHETRKEFHRIRDEFKQEMIERGFLRDGR